MISICDDHFAAVSISYEEKWGELITRKNLFSVLFHVRIADSQQ